MIKEKNPHAVALGSIKSKKKSRTSRENGKLGGRPVIKQKKIKSIGENMATNKGETTIHNS